MAAKARQQYYADGEYIDKQAREFQPTMEFKTKIDSIEPGAQVNIIEDIKVNGTSLEVDDKTVDISIPLVIDNLYSTDGVNALSAKQGKVLYDLVQNLASRGRYLSNWNAATGLPTTNPVESHYQYRAGDYYVVSNVAAQGGINYRPEPGEFVIGQASVTVETEVVKVTDMYLYDGTNWNLLINSTREIAIDSSLSTSSTNPVENRVVTNAINGKQDTLVAGSNIQIASDGKTISATDTTYTAGTNVSIDANNEISAVDTTYTAGANVQISNENVISATDTTYAAGDNIAITNNTISATYTAGTGIDITNGVISNTQTSAEWGNITGTLSDQTDLQNALDDKQDEFHTASTTAPSNPSEGDEWYDTTNDLLKVYDGSNWIVTGKTYTAGTNIDITNDVISADTQFVVVDTLPAVATADENKVYILGPIGEGADKYEEWIVTQTPAGFVSDSTVTKTIISYSRDGVGESGYDWNFEGAAGITDSYIGFNNLIYEGGLSNLNCMDTYDSDKEYKLLEVTLPYICEYESEQYGTVQDYMEYPAVFASGDEAYSFSIDAYTSASELTRQAAGKQWTKIGETSVDLSGYATTTDLTNGLATKQDTLTAGDGIDIDGSNNISVDVTDIIGTGLSEDANNNIIVDTTVVATQTDLSGKQDKATSGSTAPSTTPSYVGQQYVDTTNDKMYVATGTTSSSDWTEVGAGSGDMLYSDFNWVTKTGATITLDLRSEITPSTDFTVNKPSTLEDGQYYILRVTSGATAYTMTLGTNVTNPYSESLTLEASTIQQFTFLAKGGNLELQPSSEIDISGKQDKATSGSTAPSTTPSYVGQQYIDTTNDVLYVATGTTSSSDWTIAGKTYSAGDGIDIVNDEISVDTDVIQEKLTAGTGIEITGGTVCTQESDRKGPAPSGFHVPKKDEWQGLQTIMNGLSLTTGDNWRINLHIPFAGRRDSSSADVGRQGLDGYYWSSTPASSSNLYVRYLLLVSSSVDLNGIDNRAKGYSVRCFKNSFEVPTASWTVITGTLGSAGIFWNQTEGLISITSNGTTGYTIQDKNIGATAVYNDGDTLTQANMGNFYQWGNNYGFPSTGYISNISYTQVDTSNYGPTNPYSSDTFITGSGDWSSVRNDDLWGNTSNSTHEECVESPLIISADTTVLATKTDLSDLNTKTFYLSNINDLTTATAALQWHFAGKNAIIVYRGYAYTIGTSSSSSPLVFISTIARSPDSSLTKNWIKNLQIFFDSSHNATVIHDSTKLNEQGFLETDYNYSTPYTPTYAGSPATKKYVDDNVVQKSATAPSSPVEGTVWYDTTNDILKAYDGTNWNVVGNGDMAYADFNWVTKTGATVTLDFNSVIEPSANFTVNAPSTIKDGQIYILRVESGATAYTMTLGTGITNPYSESTTLTANKIKLFTFLAIDGNLELQPSISPVDISGKQDKATSGTSVPATTPSYIGQEYIKTNDKKLYIATGTTSSTDWTLVGGDIQLAPNSPLTPKYLWYGTQAQYNALSQYYTDEANDTVYFTI